MKNNRNSKARGAKKSAKRERSEGAHVTVHSAFSEQYSVNTANIVNLVGLLSTATGTGFLQGDVNISSLTDIFRLFRIDDVLLIWGPSTGTSTAAVQIPAGILGFTPFGINATPTVTTSFETPLVSKPTIPFGTTTTTTPGPLVKENSTSLHLTNADMPVLQGAGGGWLATQDDGTQGNFGSVFWALAAATAANTINYFLQSRFDISFKDLLDPSLISDLMQKHPQGFPTSWEFPVQGTPIHQASLWLKQGIPKSIADAPHCETTSDGPFPGYARMFSPPMGGVSLAKRSALPAEVPSCVRLG